MNFRIRSKNTVNNLTKQKRTLQDSLNVKQEKLGNMKYFNRTQKPLQKLTKHLLMINSPAKSTFFCASRFPVVSVRLHMRSPERTRTRAQQKSKL